MNIKTNPKIRTTDQEGFAFVEAFIILVLIISVGLLGNFALKRIRNNNSQAESKSSAIDPKYPGKSHQSTSGNVTYQVNIPFYQHDSAGNKNAFINMSSRLRSVSDMGVNVIQLTPVHTSAYLVLDHYDVSWKYTGNTREEQGTKESRIAYFKNYVNYAHRLKMKVIMDCVYHGTAINSPLVQQHPDWYKRNHKGDLVINRFGLPQLDTSKEEVRAYIKDVTKYWIENVGIDGCRADMAHSVPLSFWADLNNEMKKIKSSWTMVGEAFGTQAEYAQPYSEGSLKGVYGFDGVYDFYHQSVIRGIVDQKRKASEIEAAWNARPKYHRENFYNMIDDHNITIRSATLSGGNSGMVAAMAVNFTLDGMPFIFNGQEIGDTTEGGPQIDETRYYSWENPPHPENRKKFKQLICLRRNNKSLSKATTVWNKTSDPDGVVSYTRTNGKEKTLVVVNLSNKKWSGTVNGKLPSSVFDMISRKNYKTSGKSARLSLKPFSYFVANASGSKSSKAIALQCSR